MKKNSNHSQIFTKTFSTVASAVPQKPTIQPHTQNTSSTQNYSNRRVEYTPVAKRTQHFLHALHKLYG